MFQTCFSDASPFSLRRGLTQFYCLVQTWLNSKNTAKNFYVDVR